MSQYRRSPCCNVYLLIQFQKDWRIQLQRQDPCQDLAPSTTMTLIMVIRKHTASTQFMIKKMDHAIKEAILEGIPFQMIKKKLFKTYPNAEANFKETKGLQRLYQKVSICYNFAAILSNILWEFLFLATKLFNFRCKIVKSSRKFVKNSRKFITFSREIVKFPKLGKTRKLAANLLKN